MRFWRENFEDGHRARLGLLQPCTWEFLLLSGALINFQCKTIRKYFVFEPGLHGIRCQLYSLRRDAKIEKFNSTRKRNFKSKRTRSVCVGTSDLSNDTKSRETIPLNGHWQEKRVSNNIWGMPLVFNMNRFHNLKCVDSPRKYSTLSLL
jgi:hypothetical protein